MKKKLIVTPYSESEIEAIDLQRTFPEFVCNIKTTQYLNGKTDDFIYGINIQAIDTGDWCGLVEGNRLMCFTEKKVAERITKELKKAINVRKITGRPNAKSGEKQVQISTYVAEKNKAKGKKIIDNAVKGLK